MRKKIAYSISGDGGGHVSRNQYIIDWLSTIADVDVYSYSTTLSTYTRWYKDNPYVRCLPIPGIIGSFDKGGLSAWGMIRNNIKDVALLPKWMHDLKKTILDEGYYFTISDCEMYFSQAAYRASKKRPFPRIHINHHPIFGWSNLDFPKLPPLVDPAYRIGSNLYMPKADLILINSFYTAERFTKPHMHFIGPVLRESILEAQSTWSDHVLVYLKHSIARQLYPILTACTQANFIVYTSSPEDLEAASHITLKKTTPGQEFIDDLASSCGVIGVAGIDLPSEAMLLGKPMFGVAEKNQFEQYINGYQLEKTGGGMWAPSDKLAKNMVDEFLQRGGKLRQNMLAFRENTFKIGNEAVKKYLSEYLSNEQSES